MIYIRKSGIFYENNYSTESDEYLFTKVESVIPYLNEIIHMDSEITLEDFFLLLANDEDIVNIVFGSHMGHFPLRPYLDEIKTKCLPENREDLEHIECSWVIEQFDYKEFYERYKSEDVLGGLIGELREPEGDEVNDIVIYVDVFGLGKFSPQKDEEYKDCLKPPTHSSYAIEFTPLYKLKHLPIKLNKKFIIREEQDIEQNIVVEGEREFSVFQVFGAILSELTFAGLPEERWKKVIEDMEEHKKKMEDEDEDKEE